ncbi:MAG: lactate utilization protein [Lachnospiraceae bacterium]|nr:lactate utilization protein [Lachnospiraceae bacterium]
MELCFSKEKIDDIIKELGKRNMTGYYAETSDDAKKLVLDLVPEGATFSGGGSMTVQGMGLYDALREKGCEFIDYMAKRGTPEYKEMYAKATVCDWFFMSTNAMTEDGMLVNIDGSGNRVANLIHGPEHVIIVTGINKICPDLDSAVYRARNIASPPNCRRLNKKTPCVVTDKCEDCFSPDCICNQFVITRRSRNLGRIFVIIVNEELGF